MILWTLASRSSSFCPIFFPWEGLEPNATSSLSNLCRLQYHIQLWASKQIVAMQLVYFASICVSLCSNLWKPAGLVWHSLSLTTARNTLHALKHSTHTTYIHTHTLHVCTYMHTDDCWWSQRYLLFEGEKRVVLLPLTAISDTFITWQAK